MPSKNDGHIPHACLDERVASRDVDLEMAAGRSNGAIAARLFLSEKTVEAYIGSLFGKLGLEPAEEDHRRVLAVLAFLQSR